ncbi:MAG: NTP transferase domain-containing protein [Rhodocyclales bacterium]|nr:NTP transferase domain-containing protein [Rhodocyclales bacterium]
MPTFAAIIVAAGYSSRMGSFKPLAPLAGKSALEWTVAACRDGGVADIGVVTGHRAADLAPELKRLKVAALHNPAFDTGMYSSIRAGLASLAPEVDACFLLPVDIPLVRASTVRALAERYAAIRTPLVYPAFRGQRGHPPLIGRELFAEILAGDGTGGLRAVLQRHQADVVAVADQSILLDMDTPEDHARLAARAAHHLLPSVAECEAMLEMQGVGEPLRRHCRAVAAVATALAGRLPGVDPQLVMAGGLLHDIAKGQPAHAEAGAARVAQLGYPAVAEIVGKHMDFDFTGGLPDAAAVVFIADKLVREDRRVQLASRFQPAIDRYAGQPDALAAARRRYRNARNVLAAIEAHAGMGHEQILAGTGVAA